MKRLSVIVICLLAALSVHGVTPEVGKEKLRKLIKLPTLSFQPDWTFDPEKGFSLGSGEEDTRALIETVRKGLKFDNTDAEREQRLAELYADVNEKTNSRNAWNHATEYYRQRLASQPDNAVLLSGLGLSLQAVGREAEAESFLRRAVQSAPTDWKCRIALGRFLDARARRGIVDHLKVDSDGSGDVRPSADSAALSQKWLDEAGECFDRAVAVAPNESEVYFRRAMHRCLKVIVLNQVRLAGGPSDTLDNPLEGVFSADSLADLQHASRLAPRDYRLTGATALFEIYSVTVNKGEVDWDHFSWNTLSGKSQSSVREALARLDDLTQAVDSDAAAGAAEVLGILEGPVLHEPNRSISSLRHAVALQPERRQAWEILVATLAQTGQYGELLDVCEDQVKHDDSARAHLMLAKAHEKLQQWEDCEDEARVAVSDDPDNALANLSLGALLLKRSHDDEDLLSQADDWLTRSESALRRTPADQRNRQQVIDLTLLRGIYFALSDEMDNARKWVQTVIDRDKDNQLAKEIMDAMDY